MCRHLKEPFVRTPLIRRLTALAAVVAAFVLVVPGSAVAASANITGTTTSSNWVVYSTVRTVSPEWSGTVSLSAHQLLGGTNVSLRLRTPADGPLAGPQHWSFEELHVRKNIVTGLATGVQFQIGACCYSGGSSTWGGYLRW